MERSRTRALASCFPTPDVYLGIETKAKFVHTRDARFRAGVRKGVEQGDRGEFIDKEEMDARVKRMFRP